VAHSLGEVVGLGLRNLAHCPVELNLIPESTRRLQSFNEKKPYLIAAIFSLVAVVAAMGLLFQRLADVKKQELEKTIMPQLRPLQIRQAEFDKAYKALQASTNELSQLSTWIDARYYWADVLSELRRVLIRTEQRSQKEFKGADTGVWIEQFLTVSTASAGGDMMITPGNPYGAPPGSYGPGGYAPNRGPVEAGAQERYNANMGGGAVPPPPVTPQPGVTPIDPNAAAELGPASTNLISNFKILCRAVDLTSVAADANSTIVTIFESELRSSPMFDPAGTHVSSNITPDETTHYTFTVNLAVALKRPLKL
jgi:hypothetical protein